MAGSGGGGGAAAAARYAALDLARSSRASSLMGGGAASPFADDDLLPEPLGAAELSPVAGRGGGALRGGGRGAAVLSASASVARSRQLALLGPSRCAGGRVKRDGVLPAGGG
jgi:hypothetical protein